MINSITEECDDWYSRCSRCTYCNNVSRACSETAKWPQWVVV